MEDMQDIQEMALPPPAKAVRKRPRLAAAAQPKLETGGAREHMKQALQMLSGACELVGFLDVLQPAPSHPALFEEWRQGTEGTLQKICEDSEIETSAAETSAAACLDTLDLFLQKAQAAIWSDQPAAERKAYVSHLLSLPQVPQRTPDWYAQGKQVLTASEFSTIFKTPRAVSQLVLTKAGTAPAISYSSRLACMSCEIGPFDWGIRFEPVVKQVLERKWGATIAESGRLLHPSDPRLAASPDGLILDAEDPARVGRLVEIKCPISREIGGVVPFDYWCQMQLQMEVTGVDECEYVEVKIDSIAKQKAELGPDVVPEGYLWLFQNPLGECEMVYAYTEEQREEFEASGFDLIETIPWRIERLDTRVVPRDRAWFQSTAEKRESFWADVEKAKAGEFQPVAATPKKRVAAAGKGQLVLNIIKEGGTVEAIPAGTPVPAGPACMILDD